MVGVVSGGGSLSLAELVDEHGPWLAADFLSEYSVRLADVVLEWSPREVLALVEVLPVEARLWAHMEAGDQWREFHGWGKDRHMFADLWDLTAAHAMAGSKKKPPTYRRPVAAAEKPKQFTLRDFLRTAALTKGGS